MSPHWWRVFVVVVAIAGSRSVTKVTGRAACGLLFHSAVGSDCDSIFNGATVIDNEFQQRLGEPVFVARNTKDAASLWLIS